MDHILLGCPYSKEVWEKALMLNPGINLPDTTQALFLNWMKLAPFHLDKKTLLQSAWRWSPKAICWKIWLERNNRIFRDKENQSSKIASQARAILGEALEHNSGLSNSMQLSKEESIWLTNIVPNHQNRPSASQVIKADWEIRLEETRFDSWRESLNETCLFFDGASKGNPGKAGSGGVLIRANGTIMSSYHWGLGTESNNIAEYCGLLQCLRIANSKGINTLSVFGDSRMLIQVLIKKKHPVQVKLALLYHKIQIICKKFHSISFYHILRGMNSLADKEANKGALLNRGTLNVDGTDSRCDIP